MDTITLSDIQDPLFRQAVYAMDSGDVTTLKKLLAGNPHLASNRLAFPEPGYFQNPYLIWFVADNPIRNGKLPANIVEITRLLIQVVKQESPGSAENQLNYTLGLVATGRIPKESGKQIEMIDLLLDEGATPGGDLGPLAHGNVEAAKHLIKRGGELTLAGAACLDQMDEVTRMLKTADGAERLLALTAASFYGKSDMVSLLLRNNSNPNGYPEKASGFHTHATPLHQAVFSGSLDTVKLLVEAGAKLDAVDKIYGGTPLGWAQHMHSDSGHNDIAKQNFSLIAEYLKSRQS